MRLQEIMKSPVQTIAASESVDRARAEMARYRIHHLIVVADRKVVGIVSDRDLRADIGAIPVREVMAEGVVTASPNTTLREAANLLRGHTIGCIPVVERGKLTGIVTVSDILTLIGRGTERPVALGKRWTLKHRGPRMRQR